MGLKATRKLLSVIFTIITAVCTVLILGSLVLGSTFSTQGYLTRHLINDELIAECEAQLNTKYDALEVKSGIPSRVFKMVEKDYSIADSLQTAVQYIFTDESSTLYNQDKVDYFYKLCTEYLDGNDISYKKAFVENTAREAAEIYSGCVGIHNADSIKDYLSSFNLSCARVGSAALVVVVAVLILLTVMYRTSQTAYMYCAGGIAGGSFAALIGSVLCIITKVGSDFHFEPYVYQQSFYSMTRLYFIILCIASAGCLMISYAVIGAAIKKSYKDKARKENRSSKMIGKF